MYSLNARSGDHTSRLAKRALASRLGVVRLVLKKTEGRFGVLLGMEGDIEAGLGQGEAKEFAFAWAVFDQEDGGVRHHIKMTSQGLCRA